MEKPSHSQERGGLSAERKRELDQRFTLNPENYPVFSQQVGHVDRPGAKPWSINFVTRKYVTSTDNLIGILDGSIEKRDLADPDNPELSKEKPDVVIYLDKSARPVHWFVKEFWDQMAEKQPDGSVSQPPEVKFLNVDRKKWLYRMEENEGKLLSEMSAANFDINQIPEEDILGIRAIFTNGKLSEDNWQEEVVTLPNQLDHKKILIVDEVKSSGATLSIAQKLLKRAFPNSVVSGSYFWKTLRRAVGNSGDTQMGISPVWYDSKRPDGRGIGDLNYSRYEQAYSMGKINLKQYLGRVVLSSPIRTPDELSLKIRAEIVQMAQDLREGRVLHIPSYDRLVTEEDYDNFEETIKRQGLKNMNEFRYIKENS